MKSRKLATATTLASLISVTATFYWLANDEGDRRHSDFLCLVRQIDELNSKIDAEVFSIRHGVVNDLDRLVSLGKQLHDTVAQWNLQSAALDCLEPWQGNVELSNLLDQKQSHVEDFKSIQSVMRNSVASFMSLATSLRNSKETNPLNHSSA